MTKGSCVKDMDSIKGNCGARPALPTGILGKQVQGQSSRGEVARRGCFVEKTSTEDKEGWLKWQIFSNTIRQI